MITSIRLFQLIRQRLPDRIVTPMQGWLQEFETEKVEQIGAVMTKWKFEDPQNVAVFVNRKAIRNGRWVARVVHDDDDGSWQFHADESEDFDESDIMIISLKNMVEKDKTIMQLADLPYGWYAWRETKTSPWRRGKTLDEHPESERS
ncbi:hypothetical protein NKH33_26110 [Mesorhizobium sp. M1182]|uniref:hypothetical protein n=1 Tax=unclassified Mesorhizobium TaxID=325217 RepID=UPI00333B3B48